MIYHITYLRNVYMMKSFPIHSWSGTPSKKYGQKFTLNQCRFILKNKELYNNPNRTSKYDFTYKIKPIIKK